MAKEDNEIKTFTINDKTYEIDKLSDEGKTKLSLTIAAERAIGEYQAKLNLIMISKDTLIAEILKEVDETDNGSDKDKDS